MAFRIVASMAFISGVSMAYTRSRFAFLGSTAESPKSDAQNVWAKNYVFHANYSEFVPGTPSPRTAQPFVGSPEKTLDPFAASLVRLFAETRGPIRSVVWSKRKTKTCGGG